MHLTADLSGLKPELRQRVVKHMQHEDMAKHAIAEVQQAEAVKTYRNLARTGTTKDGFGPLNMIVMPYFRNQLSFQHGGAQVWSDPDFREWVRKRHKDETAIPEVGTRIQSGWRAPTL